MYNKVCKDCGVEFVGARNSQYCPECKVLRRKETYKKVNRKRAGYLKEYSKSDKAKAARKEYYNKNKDKIIARNNTWRKNNLEKVREYTKKYDHNHLVYLADNFNSIDDLSEKDKKFIYKRRDCDRIIETNLQYGRLKPVKAGYERHHIIPYKTCFHYWKLTGDTYYRDLTWKDDNIIPLTHEDHMKLHAKLSKFGYSNKVIVPEEDWEEYTELVFDLIYDKNQSNLFDF